MQKDYPSQWAYIATEDGYISTSDIEDEEEKENDDGEEKILGAQHTSVTTRPAAKSLSISDFLRHQQLTCASHY